VGDWEEGEIGTHFLNMAPELGADGYLGVGADGRTEGRPLSREPWCRGRWAAAAAAAGGWSGRMEKEQGAAVLSD
jgi:hypothetical protein